MSSIIIFRALSFSQETYLILRNFVYLRKLILTENFVSISPFFAKEYIPILSTYP